MAIQLPLLSLNGIEAIDVASIPLPYGTAPISSIQTAATHADLSGLIDKVAAADAAGHNVYMRPHWRHRSGPVLIDDVSHDTLDQMIRDDLALVLAVETSAGNFQAWINLHAGSLGKLYRDALAMALAQIYDGDPEAAISEQFGRVVGTRNHKPQANGFLSRIEIWNPQPPRMPTWGERTLEATRLHLEAQRQRDAEFASTFRR
jgi:hypothetical protein